MSDTLQTIVMARSLIIRSFVFLRSVFGRFPILQCPVPKICFSRPTAFLGSVFGRFTVFHFSEMLFSVGFGPFKIWVGRSVSGPGPESGPSLTLTWIPSLDLSYETMTICFGVR